ncbi:MAG: hypothetical protein ACREJD_02160 [Phycisphaerales bacterium]
MKILGAASLLALAGLAPFRAEAGITYNESTQGDLSDNRLAPTHLNLSYGSNTLAAKFGKGPTPDMHDLDYVSFTVPPGRVMSHIVVTDYFDDDFNFSFIGVQAGSTFTIPFDSFDVGALLGYSHFSRPDLGLDIMPTIAAGPGAQGFTPPLAAGTYTFWIQELSTVELRYGFDFQVEAANGCPADFNTDDVVDDADFSTFVTGYNILDCADPSMPAWCPADLNGDGLVDDADFVEFVVAYNTLLCP